MLISTYICIFLGCLLIFEHFCSYDGLIIDLSKALTPFISMAKFENSKSLKAHKKTSRCDDFTTSDPWAFPFSVYLDHANKIPSASSLYQDLNEQKPVILPRFLSVQKIVTSQEQWA